MSNPTSRDQQRLEHVEACLEEEHDRRDGEDFASDRGKTIKEAILAKVTRERNVSFAEIEDIEGCRGEYEMRFPDINVVLWSGLSAEAIDAIEALQKEGLILQSRLVRHCARGGTPLRWRPSRTPSRRDDCARALGSSAQGIVEQVRIAVRRSRLRMAEQRADDGERQTGRHQQ